MSDTHWKVGNEFAPYHKSASHCPPDYRDGWNNCYEMASAQIATLEQQVLNGIRMIDKYEAECDVLTDRAEAAESKVDALMREQLQPWADDVALMGPNAPKWNGQTEHLIRYLLTVYKRFGNTAITADLQWGASALHKRDAQKYDIARLEANVENLMREKEELIERCAKVADEWGSPLTAKSIRALVREQHKQQKQTLPFAKTSEPVPERDPNDGRWG